MTNAFPVPASLRTLLLVAASVVLFGQPKPAGAQLAAGHAKFLGNVYSTSQLPSFEAYWNQVTPENAGKWGSAEPQRDQMNWGELDAMYAFAKANGFPMRFHVLVWGNQQPAWIETLPAAEQLEEIEEWFAAVAARYPDLDYVEVVNEPLHDPPNSPGSGGGNYIEALGGSGSTGWDWILNAFRLARTHFPQAKLMINDYGIVSSSTNASRYAGIVELLKTENLIDGIGVQAHAFSTAGASESAMLANLDRLAATGLPIQVTEMDIDGASDATQWQEYRRVFPVFWEHPAVEGITLWGWRPGMWRTQQRAYLVNTDGSERLVLRSWMRGYLDAILASDEPGATIPGQLKLTSAYPNPFATTTTIAFELASAGSATLTVIDLTGKTVASLRTAPLAPGVHTLTFPGFDDGGRPLPAGVYFARLSASMGSSVAIPLVLMR